MASLLKTFNLPQLARSTLILALSICILAIAWSNYVFFSSDLQSSTSAPPKMTPVDTDDNLVYGVKDIHSWKIFGSYKDSNTSHHNNIEKTNLSIKLFGTFFNESEVLSAAIMSMNKEPPVLVAKNSDISTNIILKEINAQSVIIDNNGRLEKVELSDFESVAGLVSNENNPQPGSDQDSQDKNTPKTARERALEKYGLEPVAEGSASGYRITEEAKELIEKFNLNPGDIILSVNGYPVGENDSDTLAIKSFQGSGSASVAVNQKGKTTVIEYRR